MILVTGGAGFIGSHAVRALHGAGEECVVLQRREPVVPPRLADLPVHMAQGDIADLESLRAVGRQHQVTGILHLAITLPWEPGNDDPVTAAERTVAGFLNVARVAREWQVRRVVTASTIGVYADVPVDGALAEDLPLPVQGRHAIPAQKQILELLAGQMPAEMVTARISGTWGPGGHMPDPFFAAPSLAYAAAHGIAPDLSGLAQAPSAEDSLDLCYVKDTGRALALLQLAPRLRHATYNVGAGRATSNAEVIDVIASVEPGFQFELPSRGERPRRWLDITRLHEDTGFVPAYDTAAAAADYIAWLRA